ncbi:MAG: extracellular solute-binding protein [Cyanobacteria bacterium P01_F01_bin.150]
MAGKIKRRSLLLGAGSLALTQVMTACQLWQSSPQFLVEFLAASIPAPLLKKFQAQIKEQAILRLRPIAQLSDGTLLVQSEKALEEGSENPLQKLPFIGSRSSKAPITSDVVSLSDSWLQVAVQQQQLEPLSIADSSEWQTLPPAFQSLVTRDNQGFPDSNGNVWGAPYRWGHLMIAYRADQLTKIGQSITDWQDLWQDIFKGHISLLDSDRVVLGIVLKSLGKSINTIDLAAVSELESKLIALNSQVKFYSSDSYLQPLLLKDTWIAVGWSTDILPLVRRDRRINAVVPESGTILTADVWVKPVNASLSNEINSETSSTQNNSANQGASPESDDLNELVRQWIEFFWKPSVTAQLSLLSPGASPILLSSPREELPSALANDSLLILSADIMNKSEFLEPLTEEVRKRYLRYWSNMRRSV